MRGCGSLAPQDHEKIRTREAIGPAPRCGPVGALLRPPCRLRVLRLDSLLVRDERYATREARIGRYSLSCALIRFLLASTPVLPSLASAPAAFAGVRAVKRTALLPPSLRSWAEPDSLIPSRTALCAAAFPSVTPHKVGGECSGPTGLARRYCRNGDSQNRKRDGLQSAAVVWVSPLLRQPDRSLTVSLTDP